MRRAFTLVELLTVISIIAILGAILMPAAMSARALAFQYSATQSLSQLGMAANMYVSDNDETFMPAMYPSPSGFQAWFGRLGSDGKFVADYGLLVPYTARKRLTDSTFHAKDYFGDHSGFGYNWGFLGSDFGITANYATFPTCTNEATTGQLSAPSQTISFATSSFYNATWLPHGDGQVYDLGVIDPPSYWHGNPNVDFRFNGGRIPDNQTRMVFSDGNAPVFYVDGHAAGRKQTQVQDDNFVRTVAPNG